MNRNTLIASSLFALLNVAAFSAQASPKLDCSRWAAQQAQNSGSAAHSSAEKRDGEAAAGLEVIVPGQELALAAFCTQAFPVIQRMGLAGLGWLKRGRAEKTRSVAKIVRIQGFTDACQSL